MRLHEKISFIRNLKGLKQDEMAQKLNMSESGYAKIERGETKLLNPRVEKIAEALGIETEDLNNFNESSICITSFRDHNVQIFQNYANITTQLSGELEKYKFMVEQKDKEITYLKEIIELMKKNS